MELVRSASYLADSTARQIYATGINETTVEKVIEQVTTELTGRTVFSF